MSLENAWKDSVAGAEEKPVPGTKAAYPLLGADDLEQAEPAVQNWRVRLILQAALPEEQGKALSEDVAEVLTDTPSDGEVLSSFLRAEKSGAEARVWVDLLLLRNIAEIQRLQSLHPECEEWVLVCPGEAGDDPEVLVGETIRQLTGVLSGCQVLELRQGEGESFNSLWGRLNVARLMATESELQNAPDATTGSGLLALLQERLKA